MISIFDDFFQDFIIDNSIYELNELLVGVDNRRGFSLHVDPAPTHNGNDAYFKFYDSSEYESAEFVARIKFKKPEYVIHNGRDRKKTWKLVSHDKKNLIKFLKSRNKKHPDLTNWQYAIILFNKVLNLPPAETMNKLSRKFDPNKHLPIDLKMPDYSKLPTL